jgi:hypothetical protein
MDLGALGSAQSAHGKTLGPRLFLAIERGLSRFGQSNPHARLSVVLHCTRDVSPFTKTDHSTIVDGVLPPVQKGIS